MKRSLYLNFTVAGTLSARSRFRLLWCGMLLLPPILTTLPVPAAQAQGMRAADPAPLGQTIHFTLDKDEQKDLAITLPPGKYYIIADTKNVDDHSRYYVTEIDLLKTNGALVQRNIVSGVGNYIAFRNGDAFTVGTPYTAKKPLAARLRIKGQSRAQEYWITVQPADRRTFVPFGYANGELKPLGTGTENGKGGTLDRDEWAYHTIKLPAGKYNVSLYMKRASGSKGNIFGKLMLLDAYGVESKNPSLDLAINENEVETRKEERIVLLKPQTLIVRVTNDSDAVEYTVGIEEADSGD